ncbi:hypothetical protein BH23ACT9_BH23ACT9_08350 [soil metagenome]
MTSSSPGCERPVTTTAAVLPAGLHERLADRYATPPRSYHTLEHAAAVAARAADLGGDRPCLLAAWFHDAVYDPTADDNEARSADLLLQWLPHDLDAPEAARLVRLTATHDAEPDDERGGILCDADLAVLGADPEGYEAYRRSVRREYAHVDDEAWSVGRAAVLQRLLERPHIYRSPQAAKRWEASARRNLLVELRALRSGDPGTQGV